MEEILSSIKRIIADEDRAGPRAPRRGSSGGASRPLPVEDDGDDQILELTEALSDDVTGSEDVELPEAPAAKPVKTARTEPRAPRLREAAAPIPAPAPAPATVLSDISARAARESLASLSQMVVRTEPGEGNTLEAMVQEMLRPMLKDWLDANLPQLVEGLVKREIDRITGRV